MSDCPRCHTPLPLGQPYCPDCPPAFNYDLRERLAAALEGRYEIVRLLGRGGMAAVFLARDLVLEREVAIKVLPPDTIGNSQLIARFQQEARTAAKLDHPNIIPIHRVESEAGLVYIVMKYVAGQSLEDKLSEGRLPIPMVRHILREAALALGHAHRRRIIHRDVKPANIMLDEDGRVVLTDFGISKAAEATTQITGTGAIIGTPHYMSPEQAKGREVDGRTDQYALGIVGYRALTGELPYEGDVQAILYQQVHEPPPRLLDRRPDTPPDLRVALDRALAKDSKARFPTMEEFAAWVNGERAGSLGSGTTTVVSAPVKPRASTRSAGDSGSGVYVAMGTVAAVVWAAWIGLPKLQTMAESPSAEYSVGPPGIAAPKSSRSPASSRAEQRRSSVKNRGPAKLRVVESATLSVRSSPRAVLFVDGVKIGSTPITNHRLAPGPHRLRIEQKGYKPVSETIVVRGTRPINRRYDLRRQ